MSWQPIRRAPGHLWILCFECGDRTLNEDKHLADWQQSAVGRPRLFRCADCAARDPIATLADPRDAA